jgi:hypothetical protein
MLKSQALRNFRLATRNFLWGHAPGCNLEFQGSNLARLAGSCAKLAATHSQHQRKLLIVK